jgi:hypothetical protein
VASFPPTLRVELLPDDRGQHYGKISKPASSTSGSRMSTLNSDVRQKQSSLSESHGGLAAGLGSHSSMTLTSFPTPSPAMPPGGSRYRRDTAPETRNSPISTVSPKTFPVSKHGLLRRLQRNKNPVHETSSGGCAVLMSSRDSSHLSRVRKIYEYGRSAHPSTIFCPS